MENTVSKTFISGKTSQPEDLTPHPQHQLVKY